MRFWPKLWALFQSVQGPLELNSCVKLAVGSPECDSLLSRSTPSLARASLISFISSQRSWVSKSVSREEKIPNIMMMMISWSRAHKPAKDCPLFFKHSLNLISAVPWDFSSKSVQWKYTSSRISRFNWDVSKNRDLKLVIQRRSPYIPTLQTINTMKTEPYVTICNSSRQCSSIHSLN